MISFLEAAAVSWLDLLIGSIHKRMSVTTGKVWVASLSTGNI